MPRRRKVPRRTSGTKPRVNKNEGRLKRWGKASDIPLDAEDQFHASRDKILLDDENAPEVNDGDEDEVFRLNGIDDSDDEGGMAEYEHEDDSDEEEEVPTAKTETAQRKGKGKKRKVVESSSEEGNSESEEETWGRSRGAYYASKADQLDPEDEEANELQEKEARMLQAKARDDMVEADFGLEDPVQRRKDKGDDQAVESPPQAPSMPQDTQSLIRHLEKTSPESLALARDWEDTACKLIDVHAKIEQMDAENDEPVIRAMRHLQYQALLSYSTTLAFYLYLRSSEKYARRPELLRSHPILSRLLTLKQSLYTLETTLFLSDDEDDEDDEDAEDADTGADWYINMDDGQLVWGDEIESPRDDFSEDADTAYQRIIMHEERHPDKRKSQQDEDAGSVGNRRYEEIPWRFSKKNAPQGEELAYILKLAALWDHNQMEDSRASFGMRKKERNNEQKAKPPKLPPPVFDLVEPDFKPSASTKFAQPAPDAFGEATSLQQADALDKSARKKSLRFHTGKIESASARRKNARTRAAGGDDDLPYRERTKEKEKRLAKEAKATVRGAGGDDLDGVEPSMPSKTNGAKGGDDFGSDGKDGEDADGYYELIKKQSKEKKVKKKADHDEAREVARLDLEVEDSVTGPRSLTRAILANKGLTPHRPKSVRNPRVKKRERFNKAKKKVSSQKAVYKGGIGDVTKYHGEQSGITKVIKSVKLG